MAKRDKTPAATRNILEPARFPFPVAMAGVLGTGAGLIVSAIGVQWGAATPRPDALDLAWLYVNVALVWTWLLLWPAMALARERLRKSTLLWDLLALLVTALPAMGVAAFLSGVTGRMIWTASLLQAALGIFAMGAMAWRRTISAGTIAGILALLAAAAPVAGYLWTEFFPAASQAWRGVIPVIAVARVADEQITTLFWWTAGTYALLGFGLWGTSRPED